MRIPNDSPLYQSARGAYDALCEGLAATMARSEPLERAVLRMVAPATDTRLGRSLQSRLALGLRRRLNTDERALRWVQIPNGSWLQVDLRTVFGELYFGGSYEEHTTRSMLEWLAPGDVFVDVGANVGYFTMLAASRTGDSGRVIAFEANPEVFQRLRGAVERNHFQSVELFEVAVTDRDEPVTFYLSNDPGSDGIASIAPWTGHLASGHLSESNTLRVHGRRFDGLTFRQPLSRIDLLKVDVEGAELAVLRGMASTFERTPPRRVVCETTLHGDVSSWLTARGYDAEPLEYLKPEYQWGNILFTRR